jgi:hypothetical protein
MLQKKPNWIYKKQEKFSISKLFEKLQKALKTSLL